MLRRFRMGVARPAGAGGMFRRFGRRQDGTVAIEYVVLGPVFFALLFGVFELMAISISVTSAKLGLDDVGRIVRVGQAKCLTDAEVKRIVCDASLTANCSSSLKVDRKRYASGAAVDAVDVAAWTEFGAEDIVLLTAVYDWKVINPLLSPFLGGDNGAFPIYGATVFKIEENDDATCS